VSPEHARIVAQTGGLVGIWPPASIFSDLAALAGGIARMADAIGVEHVGLGSDMRGLVGPSAFDSYRELPLLSKALLDRGFDAREVRLILGGNYLRVFGACMPRA
jgi:membrane dipeptidase